MLTPKYSASTSNRPRVVMLLANEFVHDTRVYKQAQSLIAWGCDVHIVAIAKPHLPDEDDVDGISVHRVRLNPDDLFAVIAQHATWWNRPLLRRFVGAPVPMDDDATSTDTPGDTTTPRTRGRIARWFGPRVDRVRRYVRRTAPTPLRLLALNHQFAKSALALEPDVIQSHDLNTLYGGALVKRLLGVPLVYDSHELFLERNRGTNASRWDRRIWAYVERRFIHRCDGVMSVADGICRHLADRYQIPKPTLVRNTQPYEPPVTRTHLLADELGIPYDRKIVIYPGAITINRGLEALIDSAQYFDNAVAVIMGYARNADYLGELVERARERGVLNRTLYFRDAVPIDQVVKYVASADLGVVPTQNVCLSYFYESSNKIFHCLMAGVPLAMSDHAEKRLIVEEHGVGVLFDETNPSAIAACINDLVMDEQACGMMARRCLDAARTLNWEHEEFKLRSLFAPWLGDRVPPVPHVTLPPAPRTTPMVLPKIRNDTVRAS